VTNKGKTLTKRELMEKVFPEDDVNSTQFVDVYIKRLREQLEEYPNNPSVIIDEGSTGYKFVGSYVTVRDTLKES
jgi:DNA-binding response OmpR family regulator